MNLSSEQLSLPEQTVSSSWIVRGRPVDFIMSLKNHRKFAVALSIPILMLGLVVAILFGHARYEATATVRVLPTYDTRLATGPDNAMVPNMQYDSFVQQQVFEIENRETITDSLKLLGSKRSLWQLPNESDQHAVERLLQVLQVRWIPDTFLITVALQGTKPQGLDKIVNSVVDAYLSRQAKQELSGADARANLLAQRRRELRQQADAERSQLNELTQELGVSVFSSDASNPFDRKLTNANLALEQQQTHLIVEQAHLATLQAQQDRVTDADLNSLASKILLGNQTLVAEKTELGNRREAAFLQLEGLAPNHPGRQVLEEEISDIDREITLIEGKAMAQARSTLVGSRSADLHGKLVEEQARVDQDQRARDGVEQEVALLKASAASFGSKYNEALAVHEQFENHVKATSEIDDRIDLLRLQTQSPGIASLELSAQVPDKPEGGKRKLLFAFFIFVAAAVGVGVPTVFDLIDPHVKSTREVEAILQIPVLGNTSGSDARLVRETIRRIALGILRERREAGTRVFVITAVGEKAGTSSLTLALSNELTELGSLTVAVEANALMPDSRYQNRLANGIDSIATSLNGSANGNGSEWKNGRLSAVVKGGSQDLCVHTITSASAFLPDRIPICQRQRHKRLAMRCVQAVVEMALADHDLVLMDAPPVLGFADTAMLLQNSAGVIVVVRAGRDRLQDVTAALQELHKLSPPVVGVVVGFGHPHDFDPSAQRETERELSLVASKEDGLALPSVKPGNTSRDAHDKAFG
jgi:polysaccharide biosynthesis transport protein